MAKLDERALKSKERRHAETPCDDGAHARRMAEFLARAERISHELEGREHSDSAELLREDRVR